MAQMRHKPRDPRGQGRVEGILGVFEQISHPEKPQLSELKGCPEGSGHKMEAHRLSSVCICVLFGSQAYLTNLKVLPTFESQEISHKSSNFQIFF